MKISWTFCVKTGQKTGIEARMQESLFSASPRTNIRGNLNVRSLAPSWLKTWLAARRKPATVLILVAMSQLCVPRIGEIGEILGHGEHPSEHSHDAQTEQGQQPDLGIPRGIASKE